MQKDRTYHEDAVKYNEGLAEYAADLAETLVDETIKKWALSVSKQHAFHARRHKAALKKLDDLETAKVTSLLQEKNVISAQEFREKLEASQEETEDATADAESPNSFFEETSLPPSPVESSPDLSQDAQRTEAGVETLAPEPVTFTSGRIVDVSLDPHGMGTVSLNTEAFDASQPHDTSESYPGGKCNEQCEGGHPVLTLVDPDEEN